MTCEGCGACCQNYEDGHGAHIRSDELLRMISAHGNDIELKIQGSQVLGRMRQVNRKCIKLGEDNRCSIYEQRPQICRTFKPGCEFCLIYKAKFISNPS